jgi:uncharacterized membrane protein
MFFVPRLPIMADDSSDTKGWIKGIVMAVVVLIIGAVIVSVASGVGIYILNTLNTTAVKLPANINILPQILPSIPSLFLLLVAVIIIIAVFFILRKIVRIGDEF